MLRIHLALVWLSPCRSLPDLSTSDINFKMDRSNGALERPESIPNLRRMFSAQKPIDRDTYMYMNTAQNFIPCACTRGKAIGFVCIARSGDLCISVTCKHKEFVKSLINWLHYAYLWQGLRGLQMLHFGWPHLSTLPNFRYNV